MKSLRSFLASKYGKLGEHYLIVFCAAAATTVLASSEHLAGIHGLHALAGSLVGLGAAALKAGYDAVRQLAVPAILAWFASRAVKVAPAPVPAPAKPAAKKKPAAK